MTLNIIFSLAAGSPCSLVIVVYSIVFYFANQRRVGCIRLIFLIVHLYLDVWLDEDHRANTTKIDVVKRLDYVYQLY